MKRFAVKHERSANKVGVDGVLIGAWATVTSTDCDVLDAGCGCGLIALMLAQRLEDVGASGVVLRAIDVERAAVDEAGENAAASPWSDRISAYCGDFRCEISRTGEISCGGDDNSGASRGHHLRYDLIVSNPPFFHAGADSRSSARMLARHADTLSPEALMESAGMLLRPGGRLAFIAQAESETSLMAKAEECGLKLRRLTRVKGNPQAETKRVMMEWVWPGDDSCSGASQPPAPGDESSEFPLISELVIEYSPGVYTEEYIALCRDFYIKM